MKRLGVIFVLFAFLGCQKGAEDPAISFISRKSRITGTWDIVKQTSKRGGISMNFEDGKLTTIVDDTTELMTDYAFSMQFDKSGDFEFTTEENFPANILSGRESFTRNITQEGQWEFAGGNGEPNKSQLLLMTTKTETTDSDQGSNVVIVTVENPNVGEVYDLIKLSNDELKMTYETKTSFGGGQFVEAVTYELKKRGQ